MWNRGRLVALLLAAGIGCGHTQSDEAATGGEPAAGGTPAVAGATPATGGEQTCPPGTERCACYGNATCNDGLVCLSDLCVHPGTGGSGSGGDPGAGAGGASETGGVRADGGAAGSGGEPQRGGADPAGAPASGGAPTSGGAGGTGGIVLLLGGTGGQNPSDGIIRGRLRDFDAGFPDYRPRLDNIMGVDGLVDESVGALFTKDQNTHDLEIVGPLGASLSDDAKPVFTGNPVDGTITTWGSVHPLCNGQPCFDYWFRDDPAYNLALDFELQLVETPSGSGAWAFDNAGQPWFPLDDLLLGNDDPEFPEHNYGFTFEFAIEFVYVPGQVFRFTGDDDVFVYVDHLLALNLGGIHAPLEGTVLLDELGLVAGANYMLHFFMAERNPTFSNFHIETTIAPNNWVAP